MGVIDLKETKVRNEVVEIKSALHKPIASPPLHDIVKRGSTVAIVANDATRPTPTAKLLRFILEELTLAEIRDRDVKIIIATGLHKPNSKEETRRTLGTDATERFDIVNHDPNNHASLTPLGTTSRDTPVIVNKELVDAEYRILTGNVEPHQIAGFTGGVKSVLPGTAGRESVERNHAVLLDPRARIGVVRGNPVREDIDEACKMIQIHFILNVVQNNNNHIVKAVAGNVLSAHRVAVSRCRQLVTVRSPEPAEIVIAPAGGYPKDIDLYQAQKAVAHAEPIVKPGGFVILAAKCSRGIGDKLFQQWMCETQKPAEIIKRFRRERFRMGAHKAFQLARSMLKVQLILVSDLPDRVVEEMHLQPASTVQEALEMAFLETERRARVTVMPRAASVLVPIRG